MVSDMEIRHFHLFCGLGGGARGFNRGEARVGSLRARFRCIGGIDSDPMACADFRRLAGVEASCIDLFNREQYAAFHGREPDDDWREAMPADIQRAAGGERPHIVFLSAPCKGFSGLLPERRSKTDKYRALNELTLRGIWLMLEAWSDDPPELIVFENVPRIMHRGRRLLDQITGLLRGAGYVVAETTHDCGEIGNLAQRRKRFLLVARHIEKVPPFLYEPVCRPLRGVGEVLGRLPVPGPEPVLPMHRTPNLQWKTWVRLALIEAGGDWRSLNRLTIRDGIVSDYGIAPDVHWHDGVLGVQDWTKPAGTISSRGTVTTGRYTVADPRCHYRADASSMRYKVIAWDQTTNTITGSGNIAAAAQSIADPRRSTERANYQQYGVCAWDKAGCTVSGQMQPGGGPFSVADPRTLNRKRGDHYVGGGHYGILRWTDHARTISANGNYDNSFNSVADPRMQGGDEIINIKQSLPKPDERLFCEIRSVDGTWHRPLTTLELAALQGLVDVDETLELEGLSDSAWRERIGNAVPPPAAQAIAGVMGRTLLLAWSGETFFLSSEPIWVRPIATALSVAEGPLI